MARFVDQLVEFGLDVEDLHIIGHSLGSQIAAFVGKYTGTPLSRITGGSFLVLMRVRVDWINDKNKFRFPR